MDERDEAATVAATVATPTRIEIVGERRRVHDATFRAQVVTEALKPGVRMRELAQRYGLCTSLVYRWRRLSLLEARPGAAVRLLPVRVREPRLGKEAAEEPKSTASNRPGLIEIEFADGIRVRVDGEASLAALRRVVAALRG